MSQQPVRLIKQDALEKDSQASDECANIAPDSERLLWLGIRQGIFIILGVIEKYKLKINRRCRHCGNDL